MTEEEAKTKWCPFVRDMQHNGGNRTAYGGSQAEPDTEDCISEYAGEMADMYPCIGSACMAWQWSECNPGMIAKDGNATDGFCGLAATGKP